MSKLSNKSNIIIKTEEMPKNILCYYVKIFDTSYLLLNTGLTDEQELAAYKKLTYFYTNNKDNGIFTLEEYETNSHISPGQFTKPAFGLSAIS